MTFQEIIEETVKREAEVLRQEVDKQIIRDILDSLMPEFEIIGELI